MPVAPGTAFNYSTGNTHVLSGLIANATGMSLCEYAHLNLFEPVKIYAEHWGRDPQAVYSGEYNLYMTPRDTCFSSSIVEFSGLSMIKGRAMYRNMTHCSEKV